MELFRNHDTDPGPEGPERSDEEIRQNIEKLYAESDYLKDRDIKVTVKNCVVTLTGTVFSPQSWQLAADLAADVRGVREIKNNLKIEPGPAFPR